MSYSELHSGAGIQQLAPLEAETDDEREQRMPEVPVEKPDLNVCAG